jgi:hypothetical protein
MRAWGRCWGRSRARLSPESAGPRRDEGSPAAAGEVGWRNVGRTWPVRASPDSPAMADGGERGKRGGLRDGGDSGPIYRLEALEAKQMSSGGGRTRPEALVGEVAAGRSGAAHGRWRGELPSVQGHVCSGGEAKGVVQVSLAGSPGSRWPRTRHGRGPPAAYGRAAAKQRGRWS